MSESDSFIQEVSEEVRQDRMFTLWKRYAPLVIGAIVLIVGAAAAWNWKLAQDQLAMQETGGAFLSAAQGDLDAQRELASATEGPAEVIAQLRFAAALAASGDIAGARETYQTIAATSEGQQYADLARLSELRLAAASMSPVDVIAGLEPLATEGAPYRPLALELRAVMRLNTGEFDEARTDLETILTDQSTTRENRARALEILNLVPAER